MEASYQIGSTAAIDWSLRDIAQANNSMSPVLYPNIHGAVYGFAAVSLAVTALSTCMRIFTKIYYFKVRRWDDYLMIASWSGLVCMWVFILVSVQYGAGDRQVDVSSSKDPGFLKYAFLHELFYALVQCLLKASIALQILHIFVPHLHFRHNRDPKFWSIVVFTLLQDVWFFIFFWVSLFQCTPITKEFHLDGPGHCIGGWNQYNITVSVWNMISDILMLVFPMVCIWKLQMKLSLKLHAAGVFFAGGLAVAASLLRLTFTIRRLYTNDVTLVLTQVALCDVGEITAGIIVGNFVPLPRFIFEMKPKLRQVSSSLRSLSTEGEDKKKVLRQTYLSSSSTSASTTRGSTRTNSRVPDGQVASIAASQQQQQQHSISGDVPPSLPPLHRLGLGRQDGPVPMTEQEPISSATVAAASSSSPSSLIMSFEELMRESRNRTASRT